MARWLYDVQAEKWYDADAGAPPTATTASSSPSPVASTKTWLILAAVIGAAWILSR